MPKGFDKVAGNKNIRSIFSKTTALNSFINEIFKKELDEQTINFFVTKIAIHFKRDTCRLSK